MFKKAQNTDPFSDDVVVTVVVGGVKDDGVGVGDGIGPLPRTEDFGANVDK